ncbi:MAG: transcription termination/antitermination protein NusA [Nitrospirae bacterium RBG_16_43_11]|nr:MAG: transcription termination/antitermination protein NusA [Nitrospirae bacterium RBG_16_43_11]
MSRELINVIEQISREKGIKGNVILEAVKAALLSAAKKRYGVTDNLQVEIDAKSGQIQVILIKRIVEEVTNPKEELSLEEARTMDEEADLGDEIGAVIEVGDFGRIAAQAAKQVIFQKVREAEWDAVYKDFIDRQGELVHGVILGQENRNYIVDLGKTEGLLPVKEQIPRETFKRGDRIKAYLLEVKPSAKGPQLILSRSHPNFVSKLFATEVPEIYERIVEIKDVVREPGDRTKISVFSKDTAVDPVGACVGMKGSRVQAVVRELRGEKIDIIPWSEDPRVFIAEALSPAVVDRVGINEEEKSALVVVTDQQLSLAIGKKGQNVRLAAKLSNWKIDIISETDYELKRAKEKEIEISQSMAREMGVEQELANENPESSNEESLT